MPVRFATRVAPAGDQPRGEELSKRGIPSLQRPHRERGAAICCGDWRARRGERLERTARLQCRTSWHVAQNVGMNCTEANRSGGGERGNGPRGHAAQSWGYGRLNLAFLEVRKWEGGAS